MSYQVNLITLNGKFILLGDECVSTSLLTLTLFKVIKTPLLTYIRWQK